MRLRLSKAIASGEISAQEVASFTRGFALWILVPCIALWLLQQSVGSAAPIEYTKWPNPQKMMAFVLQASCWAVFLYWVFVKNGAETLSRFARATPGFHAFWSPLTFRVFAVAMLLFGLVSLLTAGA